MTQLFLRSRTIEVNLYDVCKYTAKPEDFCISGETRMTYDYCTGFEVVTGEKAREIEAHTDGSCIDDFHEYLVLFFEDGTEATFRNSYVDLFVF